MGGLDAGVEDAVAWDGQMGGCDFRASLLQQLGMPLVRKGEITIRAPVWRVTASPLQRIISLHSCINLHYSNPASMDPSSSAATQQRLATVLSASYVDSDIRNALAVLDSRFVENTAESRRQLRIDVRGDVIRSNAQIVRDFSHVAEVILPPSSSRIRSIETVRDQ